MKKYAKPEHGSLEWLSLRHRIDGECVIGASEVPTLLNSSPYKSRADLYVEKTSPIEMRHATQAMRRGTLLEPALIDFARLELDRDIVVPDVMYREGRVIATLDGQVAPEWGIEAKTTNVWAEGQELPIEYVLQAQAQMFAADMERVTFSILDRHLRLSLVDVMRDEQLISMIDTEARLFAEMIDAGQPFTESPFTLPQVAELYPSPAGEVELDASLIDVLIEWNALKSQIKDLEAREKAIKDRLANELLDAEYGVINGERVVSFKKQSQTRIDQARLKQVLDEATLSSVQSTSSFRVMRSMV